MIKTLRSKSLFQLTLWLVIFTGFHGKAQSSNPVLRLFPPNTRVIENVPYANDTLKKHLLDIYLPEKAKANTPLVIWIHGGAWMLNNKYADMGYMENTLKAILDNGYALASIDYRYSTEAIFPAQVQDCNQAIAFLYDNAGKYGLSKEKFALMGFSAGGHLASMIGLSNNNQIKSFYPQNTKAGFSIKAVVDFYGPADFLAGIRNEDKITGDLKDPVSILLGAAPLQRPDLAKIASPVSYIDKNDPPFLIIHGEKDASVPVNQSVLLNSWLQLNGLSHELIVVPDAPHFGKMFDAEYIRNKVVLFLFNNLK